MGRGETSVNFKVPKRVPKWTLPFFQYCDELENANHVQHFQLFEKHWVGFFEKYFVPPKPRAPQDPMKQINKGFQKLAEKMFVDGAEDGEKESIARDLSSMVSTLPDDIKSTIGNSLPDSPSSSQDGERRSNAKRKLVETYERAREDILSAGVDDNVLRAVDSIYDVAVDALDDGPPASKRARIVSEDDE